MFILFRGTFHYQREETKHLSSFRLHPHHHDSYLHYLTCDRFYISRLQASLETLILNLEPDVRPVAAHLLRLWSKHHFSLSFLPTPPFLPGRTWCSTRERFGGPKVSSLTGDGRVIEAVERRDGSSAVWSPPSHCSWTGAVWQLSVPATSDGRSLSVCRWLPGPRHHLLRWIKKKKRTIGRGVLPC